MGCAPFRQISSLPMGSGFRENGSVDAAVKPGWSSGDNCRGRKIVRSPNLRGAAEHPLASAPAYVAAPIPHFISSEMVNPIETL